jgi:hypothetical protein
MRGHRLQSLRGRAASERFVVVMMRAAIGLLLVLVACAPADDNPLTTATDDQFVKAIGNLPFLGCEVPLFGQDAGPGSEARRQSCEQGLQKRAAAAAISGTVTPAHIADPRVKARYERLFKR